MKMSWQFSSIRKLGFSYIKNLVNLQQHQTRAWYYQFYIIAENYLLFAFSLSPYVELEHIFVFRIHKNWPLQNFQYQLHKTLPKSLIQFVALISGCKEKAESCLLNAFPSILIASSVNVRHNKQSAQKMFTRQTRQQFHHGSITWEHCSFT